MHLLSKGVDGYEVDKDNIIGHFLLFSLVLSVLLLYLVT